MNNRPGKTGKKHESTLTLPLRAASGKAAPVKKIPATESGTAEQHYRQIAEAAYFIAERRGFEAGHELDDWLLAETEVRQRGNIR